MEFKDIVAAEDTFLVSCKQRALPSRKLQGRRVFIQKGLKDEYLFLCEIGVNLLPISNVTIDLNTRKKINKFLKDIYANIFTIQNIVDSDIKGMVDIVIGRKIFEKRPVDINFYVDENYIRKAENSSYRFIEMDLKRNPDRLMRRIGENFIIKERGMSYALVGIHTRNSKKENEVLDDTIVIQGNIRNRVVYITAKKEKLEDGSYIYRLDRNIPRINEEDYYFVLLAGVIGVTNDTAVGRVRRQTQEMLENNEDKYIQIWKKYGGAVAAGVQEKYEEAGILRYSSQKYISKNEISFVIEKDPEEKEEYLKYRMENFTDVAAKQEDVNIRTIDGHDPMRFKFVEGDSSSRTIILQDNGDNKGRAIPKQGIMEINTAGYDVIIARREEAINTLESNKSGIPQLLLLLENFNVNGYPVKDEVDFIITPEIRDRHFSHGITSNQLAAIKVALETPDVALIQGPPGTGKTTVICAIVERIIEEYAHFGDRIGDILICSYQHDAVENAIEKIEVNGLPVMKFGSRGGVKESDETILGTSIDEWIRKRKDLLKKRYSNIEEKMSQRDYTEIYTKFFKGTNSIAGIVKILKEAEDIFRKNYMSDLVERANEIRKKLEITENKTPQGFMNAIYNIPVCPQHMRDNGDKHLRGAYQVLELSDKLFVKEAGKALKEIYMNWENNHKELDFEKLNKIKEDMLLEFLPVKSIFVDKKRYIEVEELLEDGKNKFDERLKKDQTIEEIVAADFMYDLENHPEFIQESLKKYMQVIGATCQQSVSGQIMSFKGISTFSVVVIDEAARANPLDLIVPVSKATQKVIFVGDHRQLPHIVEEEKVEQLENDIRASRKSDGETETESTDLRDEIEEILKKSMFQRLFENLKAREKVDGITRVATLDTQFRMHPLLGKFVSENFYENRDGIEIKSGRKAHEFAHNLPGLENRACAWLEVPFSKGKEVSGKSKTRQVEAEQIARHLKEMMDSPEAKGMSFGIITFYKKQVGVLMKALVEVGIAETDNSGRYQFKEEYKVLETVDSLGEKHYKERLLVGTVDAFQGKEFDVVYLSVVRSNRNRSARRKYGHLTVENRMCVAMSRQKKLLIAVGDSSMVTGQNAEKYIGPLSKFYKLCKENKEYGEILDYME